MELDLRLVRYFVAVADELHFGRAAARLHLAQPALSRQIRKLEDQLGYRLLERDSRHVTLTGRGEKFLADARELLRVADRMRQPGEANRVRVAHIFELSTSRMVVDAYCKARPDVELVERAMDSMSQLNALLCDRLDVAILRVTPEMLANHPKGWSHTLLRLEPMRLVGRTGDASRTTRSLFERPVEVFGDDTDSGLYNAHGNYLTALEQEVGIRMQWLGTPGAFSHCLKIVQRSTASAFLLEFDSYARLYASEGLPVSDPAELRPHYPWSIAWRDGPLFQAAAEFLEIAHETAANNEWRSFEAGEVPPWLPSDDPVAQEVGNGTLMIRRGK
ncbi:MAG TPA: LysR family transcriptional regulator [Acidimicrobiales bacterium]